MPTALANRVLLERLLEEMSIEGAPFFEAASHGLKLKKSRGLGGRGAAKPPFANRVLIERLLDAMSIDGTPFFEAGSHGLKGRGG